MTFDVTHTLIHAPRLMEIYRQVLRRHGVEVQLKDLRREMQWVWKEFSCLADPRHDRFSSHPRGAQGWWYRFLTRLCERLGVAKPSRFAGAELFDRFTQAEAWEVYPDVVPTLRALQDRELRIGVVSNWDDRLPKVLDNLGLASFFEVIEYSGDCGVEKPHPRIFERCLAALEVPAARTLHVGDSAIEDIEGAIAVGMQALRVDRQGDSSNLWQLIEPMLEGRGGKDVHEP